MLLKRRTSVFGLTLWCLLSAWVFFGGLELIEDSHLISALAEEPQSSEDYDEAALVQLASGLRSDLSSLDTPNCSSTYPRIIQSALPVPIHGAFPLMRFVRPDSPLSLPLYQQLSVLRI